MITTILFDLDGTLLPLDMDKFMQSYLGRVGKHFAHLVEPQAMASHIWEATKVMMKNNAGDKTNLEVFWAAFEPLVGYDRQTLEPQFEEFYEKVFPSVKEATYPTPVSRQVVETALEQGFKVALATNPLFPSIATEERMRWAGIDDLPWLAVTTYEDTHYCKPNPNYFKELTARLGLEPQECLMIGNDPVEDLVASELGMPTYLVTDYDIKRDSPYTPTYTGSLAEVKELLEKLR